MRFVRLTILCLLLLLIQPAIAEQEADWVFSDSLILTANISSSFEVEPLSPRWRLEWVKVWLNFLPQTDYRQQLLELSTEPGARLSEDGLLFEFWEPKAREGFSATFTLATKLARPVVKEKVGFPIARAQLGPELQPFLSPTPFIDSDDPAIVALANRLTAGEDDLFVVATKLADWVRRNINYSLNTLTAEVSQPASWVLAHREGVCDELAHLFIALARAVGIPGRFVAGLAYTESELFPERWGAHGWAELWFPGIGWVPYDVAYGEYGYVDAAHIAVAHVKDAKELATKFEWYGRELKLVPGQPKLSAKLIRAGKRQPFFGLSLKPFFAKVDFGSVNLIEAVVENLYSYYGVALLTLVGPPELIIEGAEKTVLLRPGERKSVVWPVRVAKDLKRGYVYTFQLSLISYEGDLAKAEFSSAFEEPHIAEEQARALAAALEEREAKAYSAQLELDCEPVKASYYVYEKVRISCSLANRGNVPLYALKLCADRSCALLDLGIAQTATQELELNLSPGTQSVSVIASHELATALTQLTLEILDTPRLELTRFAAPKNISWPDRPTIAFEVIQLSRSTAQNLTIELRLKNESLRRWQAVKAGNLSFRAEFEPELLTEGPNEFELSLAWQDANGRPYAATHSFVIELEKLRLWQRLSRSLRLLFASILGKFK